MASRKTLVGQSDLSDEGKAIYGIRKNFLARDFKP